MEHVTIVGLEKTLGTSITIPMEMLNAADLMMKAKGKNPHKLCMEIASADGKGLQLSAGLELKSQRKLFDIQKTDLIIIPALWGNPQGVVSRSALILSWLQEQYARKTLICAVGTGSFFPAAAGLLNNKVATTHWYYFNKFQALYPEVHLQRTRFITKAGNIYCAGSVNSVRDIMLHFIEESYNEEIAHQVSRHFTHEVKRSYTSSFLKASPEHSHDDETVINIQEWIHSYFNTELSLEKISRNFEISVRSLNRRFKSATDQTPMQYLQQVRIDNAKEMLKNTNLSIAEVAFNVGYSDPGYFSISFKKLISLSPAEYRRLVRKKLFQVVDERD